MSDREPSPSDVSQLLDAIREGDDSASAELYSYVYAELRGLSQVVFRNQPAGHTLQPTALVHEAWMKMADHLPNLEGRKHFLAIAAKAMRQVLTDHARAARRAKRNALNGSLTLHDAPEDARCETVSLVSLEECLTRLQSLDERIAAVVEYRVLGAMTISEIAAVLNVSPRTVDSDWQFARAWLRRELIGE